MAETEADEKVVKLKDGRSVKVRNYLTGEDKQALEAVRAASTHINATGTGSQQEKYAVQVDGDLAVKLEQESLRRFVTSVGDLTGEEAYTEVIRLRLDEYNKVVAAVEKITALLGLSEEKKSS